MSAAAHDCHATVVWQRGSHEPYTDQRYSRAHQWRFDGGAVVPASSSPKVVPAPYSVPANVDPEEAFVAALSSCHMLFFLFYAAQQGLVVDDYEDQAVGAMGPDVQQRMVMLKVRLRPRVRFGAASTIDARQLADLHHRANESCFLANSVKCAVEVEPAQ